MDDTILRRILSKTTTIDDFNFDNLVAPPLLTFITMQDIDYFRYLATSVKYSAKVDLKYSEIDRVMKMRGFVKLSGGTNRIVYRCLENDQIVLKIALDDVGMKDNPREFKNQFIFKPYITKIFEVSPCGTVALVERVDNIKSREEFLSIAPDVFDIISKWFVGKYILEDIGSKFFMNWGCRTKPAFGPVLLDFPYVYELDGNKLYCQQILQDGSICGGTIDYDDGFNHLYCTHCGTEYKAVDLKKLVDEKLIIEKGNGKMEQIKVIVKRGNKVIKTSDDVKKSKRISRRERIYNSLPSIDEGIVVHVKGGSRSNTIKNVVPRVEDTKSNKDFDVESKFIPPIVEEVKEYVPQTPITTDKTDDGRIIVTTEEDDDTSRLEPVEDEVNTDYIPEEDSDDESEECLKIDPVVPDGLPLDDEDDSSYSSVPVGAAPPKQQQRSKRFDPDFYNRK